MRRLDQLPKGSKVYNEGILDRGLHKIHWSVAGNPEGIPLVYSMGGPGGPQMDENRLLFDPDKYWIIQYDMRGAGKSTPSQELTDNTWRHTIEDMEALREKLEIDRWVVAGGSWGSTMSLLYAQEHPERCLALHLVCVWVGRVKDLDFNYIAGREILPECYEEMTALLSEEEKSNIIQAYARRVLGDDPEVSEEAAIRYLEFHFMIMNHHAILGDMDVSDMAKGMMKIFFHYMRNDCFMDPDHIMSRLDRLVDIPITIAQGRYDLCTPVRIAYDIKKALPHVDLRIVDSAGHIPWEKNLMLESLRASNDLHRLITQS